MCGIMPRMADHTVVNLRDVPNLAEQHGLSPDLEARFASGALELAQSGLSYQKLAPNFRVPWGHKHAQQEEIYVVLAGSGTINLDGELVELGHLDAIRVPPEVPRGIEAGPEGMEILAYGAPRTSASAAQDAEMLPGWWG
jgi:mannose-6-phosphate isomerase-like protein (cupin superfamily)